MGFQIDALLGDKVSQVKSIELSNRAGYEQSFLLICQLNAGLRPAACAARKAIQLYNILQNHQVGICAGLHCHILCGAVRLDHIAAGILKYTYEQLAAYWGDDFMNYTTAIDAESSADWEVFSVKVGTDSGIVTLGDAVELEGFACSAGGWSQAGIELTDEQKALFVPGCIVEIEYSSDAPVWLIAKGADENPNPKGNWLRGVNQEGDNAFVVDGAVADGKVQYTYEQLAMAVV